MKHHNRQRTFSYRQTDSRIKRQQIYKQQPLFDQTQYNASSSYNMTKSEQLQNYQSQINLSNLVKVFTTHYVSVERFFKTIQLHMTRLQTKIADCFGKFNKIQWKISKGAHNIEEAKMVNDELLKINKQIQQKLQNLKTDYEQLKKRKYISNLQRKVDQLKDSVHKLQIQEYKNKFNKHQQIIFQDNIDRLEQIVNKGTERKQYVNQRQVYNQIIRNLINIIKGNSDVSQWMDQKLQQNIKLKFRLIKKQSSFQE